MFTSVRRAYSRERAKQKKAYRDALIGIAKARLGSSLDPIEYFVLPQRKLVYVVNSKAGCSSIKASLLASADEAVDCTTYQNIHNAALAGGYTKFSLSSVEEAYFRFSMVRDPFSRIASLYVNKFEDQSKVSAAGYEYRRYLGGYIPREIDFDRFVSKVCDIPDNLSERHFKSQSYLLQVESSKIDYIGRLERVDTDYKMLTQRFGLPPLSMSNRSAGYSVDQMYSVDSLKRVAQRFSDDVENFGYQSCYDHLLSRVAK